MLVVPMKIFLAEDHFAIRLGMQAVLADLGHDVVAEAINAAQASALAATVEADWALLDVDLGDGTSYEAARELARRGVRVCFLTGYDVPLGQPDDLAGLPRLTKPVLPQDMKALFARA